VGNGPLLWQSLTNDEATRQQIAKNLGLEMIEPDNSDSDKQE